MVRIEAYMDSIVSRTRSLSDFINGIDSQQMSDEMHAIS